MAAALHFNILAAGVVNDEHPARHSVHPPPADAVAAALKQERTAAAAGIGEKEGGAPRRFKKCSGLICGMWR